MPEVLRITMDEALDPRVDDMLARQRNMRGELGITGYSATRWYQRAWVVLGLAGALGAFLVWGTIEPHMGDLLYFQGEIEEIESFSSPFPPSEGEEEVQDPTRLQGQVRIADQWILIGGWTEILEDGRVQGTLDLFDLDQGREVGFHLECAEDEEEGGLIAMAHYVVLSPEPGESHDHATLQTMFDRDEILGMLVFALIAAGIGLAVGCVDGIICRQPRRALLGGLVGVVVGFIGGYVATLVAGLLYAPLNQLAMTAYDLESGSFSRYGLLVQMSGRGLAWLVAGMAMGLGQGIVLRSSRLLTYGFLGGAIGGLLGGLLFDPIDLFVVGKSPSAEWSRMLGFTLIGLGVGSMIGVVELLARDAWLGMLKGPLAGKEFLLFRSHMRLGSSPRSEVYLFNDDQVASEHAVIRDVGGNYEIEQSSPRHPLLLNERTVRHARLRDGDVIGLGRTRFVFRQRTAG